MEVECGHDTVQTWLGNCRAAGAVASMHRTVIYLAIGASVHGMLEEDY